MRKYAALAIGLACFVPGVGTVAGCASGASSASAPGLPAATATVPDRGISWMSPDAKKSDLVYVTDSRNDMVTIYAYDNGKGKSSLLGKLTGFNNPNGECINSKGDVWIVNTGASQLLEYAHGGTKPIATLNVSGYAPVACAIDPRTGNLAVSSVETTDGNPGSVGIFKGAKGNPTYYQYEALYRYGFCGYDNHSNLFVDGLSYGSSIEFAELARGSQSLTGLTLDQTIESPGAIVWDGRHIAIGDPAAAAIYQFSIANGVGTKVGSTSLNGTEEVEQFAIQGSVLIAPDFIYSRVWFFKYPAGGNSFGEILYYVSAPVAVVVSKAT